LRDTDWRGIGEDQDAEAVRGEQDNAGGGPHVEPARMAEADAALVVVANIPAEPVETGAVGDRIAGRVADDLRPVGLPQRGRGDDLLALELALRKLQAQVLRQVAAAGAYAAGRRLSVRLAHVAGNELTVDLRVQLDPVPGGLEVGEPRA